MTPPVEDLLGSLMGTESEAAALELVRLSGARPADVAARLRRHAAAVRTARPAAARLAAHLATAVETMEEVRLWSGVPHVSQAANTLLRRASAEPTWIGTLAVLRSGRASLDQSDMMPVVAWHASLVQQGVPPHANGAGLVICLGAVLGEIALAYAHLAWARGCELAGRNTHAERHFERAAKLADRFGDDSDREAAHTALRAFGERHGVASKSTRRSTAHRASDSIASLAMREADAHSLRASGRLVEAMVVLNEAIDLSHRHEDREREMRLRLLRGLVHEDVGEFELGASDYSVAADLADALGDPRRSFEARTNIAASLLKRGETSRAVAEFTTILRRANVEGPLERRVAARNNLAHAHCDNGQDARALDLYLQVLDMAKQHPGSPSYTIALQGMIRTGQALEVGEIVDTAAALLLDGWLTRHDTNALLAFITSTAADLGDPGLRSLAEQLWHSLVEQGDLMPAGALALRLARHDGTHGRSRDAVRILDAYLARFADLRHSAPIMLQAEAEAARLEMAHPTTAAAGCQRLRTAIQGVERRLGAVRSLRDGDAVLAAARPLYESLADHVLRSPSPETEAEAFRLHEACRPMTLTAPGAADTSTMARRGTTAELTDVRRAIASSDIPMATLSFLETEGTLVAFAVRSTDTGVEHVRLDVTPGDARAAAAELWSAANGDSTVFPPRGPLDPDRPHARRMPSFYDLMSRLGAQIAPLLDGIELVCIVPSTSLEPLPLHGMRTSVDRHLIEDVGVVYQTSLSAFLATTTSEEAHRPRTAFVAGVAAYEDAHPEFFENDVEFFRDAMLVLDSASGTEATPSRVVEGLRRAELAHITCHGFVDAREPLDSGLLLSNGRQLPSKVLDNIPVLERGRFLLTMRRLRRESFAAPLLTLRACSTARRSSSTDDTVSTLLRALQLGGCRTILSTLWNVDQRSSLALLRSFYDRYLHSGAPAWRALAEAQRGFIRGGPPLSHIYHWGPFILSGDWRH